MIVHQETLLHQEEAKVEEPQKEEEQTPYEFQHEEINGDLQINNNQDKLLRKDSSEFNLNFNSNLAFQQNSELVSKQIKIEGTNKILERAMQNDQSPIKPK